ncbi:cf5b7dac-7baa-4aa0-a8d9-84ccfbafbd9f [Sclerotinia trifoliorum]|uniref:Cf5b7dac-7baa-4aa0-a8d9-84ccfbafbd9f n=1 Tax=Sclerotinia trifoliorum TaxID=28548 RepID=A0A8H2ZV95_9HELO|nr:cf5b7dac-7baa-4aa0-a8d9-84ccfbafbd9f [Sclerotinia trifoliorum]
MLSKNIISLLIGAASFVQTSPVPDTLNEKRTCGTQLFPNQLVQLSQANPNTAYPNTWNTDKSVKISQDIDGNGNPTNQFWELISFPALPAGSYGCSLTLTFPSDYSPTITGVSPALNVYAVSTPLPDSRTFNNISPKITPSIFGTVTPASGQSVVINSGNCNGGSGQGLTFVFRYADWVRGQGSVSWIEYVNALNGAGARGVYLNYNC